MDVKFILSCCKNCPHARLVGGEPPNWAKQFCAFDVDNAQPTAGKKLAEVRATVPVQDLRELAECPDKPRSIRYAGGA